MGTLTFIGGYGSGISVYSREADQLTQLGLLDTPDPSYLIADPERPVLYAVNELAAGTVSSYAVEPSGVLRLLSSQPTGGAEPCHLALAGNHLIAANYGSGSVSVHPVGKDGSLGDRVELVRHQGHGPRPDRQEGPHAHQVHVEGDAVTVVDLGLDRLMHYRLDPDTGRLTRTGETGAAPGDGPRHIAAHPSGRWYVSCELASTIATFTPRAGALTLTGTQPSTDVTMSSPGAQPEPGLGVGEHPPISTAGAQPEPGLGVGEHPPIGTAGAQPEPGLGVGEHPPISTAEGNLPSGVELWAGGRLFYIGNRGADTIATFTVGPDGGLTRVGEVASGGRWPRQFTIVDDLMFVVNQRSNSVVSFRLDPDTGLPAATGAQVTVDSPSCVLPTSWSV
jgi:6-phosphogluconolactonase